MIVKKQIVVRIRNGPPRIAKRHMNPAKARASPVADQAAPVSAVRPATRPLDERHELVRECQKLVDAFNQVAIVTCETLIDTNVSAADPAERIRARLIQLADELERVRRIERRQRRFREQRKHRSSGSYLMQPRRPHARRIFARQEAANDHAAE